MSVRLTLTQRYVAYLAVVLVLLPLGSYFITSLVVRNGLTTLFEHRLQRCRVVLSQYARVHALTRAAELNGVLSSSPFLAAVEARDAEAIEAEAHHCASELNAEVMVLTDPAGNLIYSSVPDDRQVMSQVERILVQATADRATHFVRTSNGYLEFIVGEMTTGEGLSLGQLMVGARVSSSLAMDLRNLTGFDVVVTDGDEVVVSSNRDMIAAMVDSGLFVRAHLPMEAVTEVTMLGKQIVYLPVQDARVKATITFVGSPDDLIAPLQSRINFFLLLLAIVGGLGAVVLIYYVTERRIGRQVDLLVGAAERIAHGDTDFIITPQSHDELGFLAGEMEKMRSHLVDHARELNAEHEARVTSERMATIGRMATGIIHDFKNPMTIIRGNVDLIQMKRKTGGDSSKHVSAIQHQIDRMANLAQDILEYGRGRIRLEFQSVNLHEYFQAIYDGQAPQFERAGVRLEMNRGAAIEVRLDPGRFRRVIDNIIDNSREAHRPGGLTCVSWDYQADGVVICIEDDGPGIPEEIVRTLFDPFVTSGKKYGTGLGLSIAQKIVQDHSGSVAVETDARWGTRFLISLPAVRAEGPVQEAVPSR